MNYKTQRILDILLSFIGLIITAPLMAIALLFGTWDTGYPIFKQNRLGKSQKIFTLVKFRTMPKDTKTSPTHLISSDVVSPIGKFLRKTKLDELPQLWNVLKGDMSLVGPRPGLPSQVELKNEREALGLFIVRPGITGLAQINGIDMSDPKLLAKTDFKMLCTMSIFNYFKYIFLTIFGQGKGDNLN